MIVRALGWVANRIERAQVRQSRDLIWLFGCCKPRRVTVHAAPSEHCEAQCAGYAVDWSLPQVPVVPRRNNCRDALGKYGLGTGIA